MKTTLLIFAILGAIEVSHSASLQTFQAADVVLGQPNFTTKDPLKKQPNCLDFPTQAAYDPTTGKVFVSDTGNSRILRFSSTAAAQNGANAEAVLGQPNFAGFLANIGGAASASTLAGPTEITVDTHGRLWVADTGNHRVLGYYVASYISSFSQADIVLGQPDFTTTTPGTTQSSMSAPRGVSIGMDDTLWISDSDNNRVLRFADVTSQSNGNPADGVLGQPGFVSGTQASGVAGMNKPSGLYVDAANRLWVTDTANNRVLRFDNAVAKADGDGANADGVLGQPNFTTTTTALDATHIGQSSRGVYVDVAGTLWIGDQSDARVLGFPSAATLGNGAAASIVLGQPDFFTSSSSASAQRLGGACGVASGPNGSLLVADLSNSRILRFSLPGTGSSSAGSGNGGSSSSRLAPTLSLIGKKKITTSKTKIVLKGNTTGIVTKVTAKIGKKTKIAKGTVLWGIRLKLRPGKNKIVFTAIGPNGNSVPVSATINRK